MGKTYWSMKSETRLRNCSVLGVSVKSISILARLMIRIATGNPDRQQMKAGRIESREGFAHHVKDVSVGAGTCAEEVVLALHLVEGGQHRAIVGVLFSKRLEPALGRPVVVAPILR